MYAPPPSAKPPYSPAAVREVCLWRAADGTKDYVDMMAYDLSRLAVTGLMNKTAISPSEIDYLLWGTVSQEIRTSNIARDVALGAGLPNSVTGHTVTQACISANQAICNGVQQIQTGRADVVIAGGVETFSDAAIRFSRPSMLRVPSRWWVSPPPGLLGLTGSPGSWLRHALAPSCPAPEGVCMVAVRAGREVADAIP